MNILVNMIQNNICNNNIDTLKEFSLGFFVQYNNENNFHVLKSQIIETSENVKFKKWLKIFKEKYSDLWQQGYCLTSKTENNTVILGYDAPGFPELERYEMKGAEFVNSDLIIKVVTLDNKEEAEVFNNTNNGYDAIINPVKSVKPEKFISKSKCKKCGCDLYKVFIKIHSTGKIDLLEEQSCEEITEENWLNAFDWLSIDLICSNCGHKIKKWFESETM